MNFELSHITLSELQRRIKTAIEEAMPLPVWIVAEISEVKVNRTGHCYMELVEKPTDNHTANTQPVAQARAVIWRQQWAMLSAYFRAATGSDLMAGMKILAKVIVSYHELYGLSLQITDLDASYTLGEAERQKQLTIEQLKADGVWDMNREVDMPLLVQRVAVVSSATAAGYRDFCNELREGGYALRIELFEAMMQGAAAEESICGVLDEIASRSDEFDAVVIIRGGGSVSDLGCFNSYRLCSYVAQFPLPVLTGIGHDKDVSVADMVANTPLKTPTAVAGWLTDRMARHEAWLDESLNRLHDMALATTANQHLRIERLASELTQSHNRIYERQLSKLALWSEQLGLLTDRIIAAERLRLQSAAEVVEARKPQNILRMGFAIVRLGDKVLHSADGISVGDSLAIELADGRVIAEAKSIKKQEK
ncbi:MAG: exodeoxyribonuclease VII large subunit [Rikenellaceae bacterium]|nr:exodeoxyribonuclease VII large subunit [Rikenellaceae bacterium]